MGAEGWVSGILEGKMGAWARLNSLEAKIALLTPEGEQNGHACQGLANLWGRAIQYLLLTLYRSAKKLYNKAMALYIWDSKSYC